MRHSQRKNDVDVNVFLSYVAILYNLCFLFTEIATKNKFSIQQMVSQWYLIEPSHGINILVIWSLSIKHYDSLIIWFYILHFIFMLTNKDFDNRLHYFSLHNLKIHLTFCYY